MKHSVKYYLLIAFSIFFIQGYSQEKWDQENAMYTNHIYNFHWNLPYQEDLEWRKIQGDEKHTVFKCVSDCGIVVFVNINTNDGISTKLPDMFMWENFEKYKKVEELALKKTKERTGVEGSLICMEKCRFAGSYAIKTIYKQELKDDVNYVTIIGITYKFHKDNYIFIVTVKCNEYVYKLLGDEVIKEIFCGFGMNAKGGEGKNFKF